MKLGGQGDIKISLKVLKENGYIRIVAVDGEWVAVITGQPNHPFRGSGYLKKQEERQLKWAHLIVKAVNLVYR